MKISAKAPPTPIINAKNNSLDDVRLATAYALALNDARVPVGMRLCVKGGHAFGMRPIADPITTKRPGQVKQWLRDMGLL